jgi:transposase
VRTIKETGVIDSAKMERDLITNTVSEKWEKDIPRRVRKFGVQEAAQNAKLAKRKKGELGYRKSRECLSEAISIEATAYGGPIRRVTAQAESKVVAITISPNTRLGKEGPLKTKASPLARKLLLENNGMQFGGKLVWEKRVNRFYLVMLRNIEPARDRDPSFQSKKTVSLDPGIKTVQTFYSPDGTHGTFLDGYETYVDAKIELLRKLHARLESIKDMRCQKKYRATRSTQRRVRRTHFKLSKWMDNQHYFIINELFREWDIVVFPVLNVSRIIRQKGRCFGTLMALRLSCISHYKLRMRCKDRAETLEGKYVIEVGEPGTSRTCGHCGHWHQGLGGSRVFRCPKCQVEIDRDVNGARNNLLATIG